MSDEQHLERLSNQNLRLRNAVEGALLFAEGVAMGASEASGEREQAEAIIAMLSDALAGPD
ncbi:MAG TPA: hypothetical protein VKG62_00920 [Solirubrobacteraceae bacterium]|nr:hypothetical protein [Solirubrobacteraceae bacterium]